MRDNPKPERDRHPLEWRNPPSTVTVAPRQQPPRRPGPRLPLTPPRLTLALLVINVGVFALGTLLPFAGRQFFLAGASRSYEVLVQGEVQRLFTAMFLHASLMHLFFNMYALYIIGRNVEALFGHARFLLIYLLGGLTGSLLSVALGSTNPWLSVPSVGASGAVFAIFGAEMVWLYRHRRLPGVAARRQLRSLLMVLGLNLAIGLLSSTGAGAMRIDNWAHLGGLAGGLALAWAIGPVYRPQPHPTLVGVLQLRDGNPFSSGWWLASLYAIAYVALVVVLVTLVN